MPGDTDNYEDGHDDDDNCNHNINMYDDDNDDDDDDDDGDDVGYIHLLTPRHDKHNSLEMNRIRTTPRHIQRSKPSA